MLLHLRLLRRLRLACMLLLRRCRFAVVRPLLLPLPAARSAVLAPPRANERIILAGATLIYMMTTYLICMIGIACLYARPTEAGHDPNENDLTNLMQLLSM
jgi:hypothetical protein